MKPDNTRASLAVALIVKNEEKHLAACLDSVKDWVDEIVILDSGSSDATEEIARQYTNKFYVSEDWPGFGIQRQRAQAFVESDYILWLDADERVTPKLRESIQNAVEQNQKNTIYQINRLSTAFGQFIHHSGWHPDWISRLHHRIETHYNDIKVHESIIIPSDGKVEKLSGTLEHYTFEDFFEFQNKQQKYAELWVEDRFSKEKKSSITSAIVHSVFSFIRTYILKAGFLDGKHGFIIACVNAQYVLNKYLGLYLKHKK
ncbi:glycosyltransferase family 2 protein [Photobacterium damselae subsp. damselae]|uniref:Glycosyltransferase family 2 protein n=1 Tax=Photobacterium damselae subsp. damselae TaxID=85581 RepID=A0A850QS62_PHODD|nr:glycosyltransferase family 2 protein [Photobacterium damselae subsp. damselae]